MVGCSSRRRDGGDDGKLHGQLITCQPEAVENLRLNGDTSHVKARELVEIGQEVKTQRGKGGRTFI
jgi:hypothetical protein